MLVCASSVCWWNDSLDEAMRKAAECGFDAFEPLTFPAEILDLHGDLRRVTARELSDRASRTGLKIVALHLGAIMTSSEQKRQALTEYAKQAIRTAEELGCEVIVDGGPDRASEPFGPFLEALAELVPVLEKTGIRFALENHYGNWIQYIQDYEHIFQHVDHPQVGITLDTGHFTSAEVDPAEVVRRFPERIFHVHVKDHVGTQSVPLGQGRTNNFEVVQELKKIGYKGYLSQELEVPEDMDSDQAARDGYQYMCRLASP